MKLWIVFAVLVLTACTFTPPEPTPPVSLGSPASSDVASTLEQIRPQVEATDREAREAAVAIIRECTQPNAHPLRCSKEPVPGSLRGLVATLGETCRRMKDDYNKIATSLSRPEIVLRETSNTVNPGHPITCDGTG